MVYHRVLSWAQYCSYVVSMILSTYVVRLNPNLFADDTNMSVPGNTSIIIIVFIIGSMIGSISDVLEHLYAMAKYK